ncbi:Leukotoxin (plasmid) [Sulfitobacter indolifex]|uniref:Right handed beta helix domain-containing protein n=1 Tax=Sulfitobacter indolifex HEL-45 TaxID=391624 RepID=A0ABP2D6B8_9RHOB|nr:right-handed parallel beta-helix repeat-containing protein [Sulfitobacter indolifex]EDQ03421.1 hypothetical protein OIHEL45_16931 [Sulfitobacter indolifex HEL-45]UOA21233.1 Leukotoxin [Sulfitobacter indolifex]
MRYYVDQSNSLANDKNFGTEEAPFLTIQAAVDVAGPGDVISVKLGRYDSVWIEKSGTEDTPITLEVHPDHEGQVIIDGGGAGVQKAHGAIHVETSSHIIIDGFQVTNAHFGISARSDGETEISDIQIVNNYVHNVDNAGIFVAGQLMHKDTIVDNFVVSNIVISGNSVTKTNLGEVSGGANEAITIGGGVDGFLVHQNHVYETDQYGINAKTNVMNGVISENVIHDIEKYGIYIDSNSRTATNIDIIDNVIFNANLGIVLSREADDGLNPGVEMGKAEHPSDFKDGEYAPVLTHINIKDNVVLSSGKSGIYLDKHHTKDLGGGEFGHIHIEGNTVNQSGFNGLLIDPNLKGVLTDVTVVNNFVFGSGKKDMNYFTDSEVSVFDNSTEPTDMLESLKTRLAKLEENELDMEPLRKEGTMQNDTMKGSSIEDHMFGYGGDDILKGEGGDDFISGMRGNDTLYGGSGDDRMVGLSDNDQLFGEEGNDLLRGGEGNDRLDGGAGNDRLYGGKGNDTFIFWQGSGQDRINDFQIGADLIDLESLGLSSFSELEEMFNDTKQGLKIAFNAEDSVVIVGHTADQLSQWDFII